ncbi:MAG: hypothetical protein Q8N96_10245, partial [Methylovulum sp.]|nr:hypothetical protein [Methylovulum sp.]
MAVLQRFHSLCVDLVETLQCNVPTLLSFPRSGVTAIKLRNNSAKAKSYIDKSPLAPLFQRGGINVFFADLVRRRTSPFEKGGSRGIFKIHNIM